MNGRPTALLCTLLVSLVLAGCGGTEVETGGTDVFVFDPTADTVTLPPLDTGGGEAKEVVAPDGSDVDEPPDASGDARAEVTEPSCPAIAPTLAEARRWLEASQPFQALELYREAEAACPDSVEARFGAALSQLVDITELTFSFVSLVGAAGGKESQDDYLAALIHDDVFVQIAARIRGALDRLDALAAEDAPVEFSVERLAVYNVTQPFLVYSGRFDRGDVHLMRCVAQVALFIVDVLRTQDMRAPILDLVMQIRHNGFDGVQSVLEAIGGLLASSPVTFGVHPDDGVDAYQEAGALLAGLADSFDDAMAWLLAEDRQDGTQVSMLRDGSGLGLLVVHAGAAVEEETGAIGTREIVFPLPPELPVALRAIADSVAQPGAFVAWKDGPRWLLAAMATVVLKLELVGELSFGGFTIPTDTLTIAIAANLLDQMVPLPIACDFGALFQTPAGLRAFLPAPTPEGDSVLLEWECPSELADDGLPDGSGKFLCAAADEADDAPHFVGTPYETTSDGIASVFPYLGFSDPTWNGLVHVDLLAVGLADEPGYAPADQTSLNAALATGVAPIMALLGLSQ